MTVRIDGKHEVVVAVKQMIYAIEKFDRSSSNLARKMLWLTPVIAVLTIVMILIMIFI